jgi:hypothetical protein
MILAVRRSKNLALTEMDHFRPVKPALPASSCSLSLKAYPRRGVEGALRWAADL